MKSYEVLTDKSYNLNCSSDECYLSLHHTLDQKEENSRRLIEVLQERLINLNDLVKKRISFISAFSYDICKPNLEVENKTSLSSFDHEITNSFDDRCEQLPHPLAFRDPEMPQTDVAKRLEIFFQRHHDKKSDNKLRSKVSYIIKTRCSLNRLESKRIEIRKRRIRKLQSQLETNSGKFLARAANSICFRIKPNANDSDCDEPEYPIPIERHEMNPEIFLRISFEQTSLNRGRGELKMLVLHKISQDLFVDMYWLIHCRFFQASLSKSRPH